MPPITWINGEFLDPAAATVSAFDASVQHAVGLFETMLAANNRIVGLRAHLDRLADSASQLSLVETLRLGPLTDALNLAVERSELAQGDARARVRLTLTGGDLNLLTSANGSTERTPTIIIHVSPAQRYPDEMFARGVTVAIADAKANPLNPHSAHKTLDYWWRLRELQRAAAAGAGEALILQVTNHLAGGAVSNIFAVKDGTLHTPLARGDEQQSTAANAIPSPVLPGITRQHIIELAEHIGVGTTRRLMSIDDALDADELFLTNSSWGVLPVVNIERSAINTGAPGPITTELRGRWLNAIDEQSI